MRNNKETPDWHNYGKWHKEMYRQPSFEKILKMMKAYYLRKNSICQQDIVIISTTQIAYSKNYKIEYLINDECKTLTINSDSLL